MNPENEKNDALKAEQEHKTAVESAADYVENFDILETITNVGNDEVFTPRKTCNMMLDSLPEEVWHNPNYKWLNPASKNGVFEREIAIRLDEGLKNVIPDEEERRKHILQKMIFSIGQTMFTANVARRTVYYCSQANRKCDGIKAPDGHYVNGYAIGNGTWFNDEEGNIKTPNAQHKIDKKSNKCVFCGVDKDSRYLDSNQLETYAYEFIHVKKNQLLQHLQDRFFGGNRDMKFDIIIGNPPYHLSTASLSGSNTQAIPIYQLFVQQAIALNPKYLCMIIPSKWFAGGMATLDEFRLEMMKDHHIKLLVDFPNAKDCFPANSIGGGVCYFLRDSAYNGLCNFTNINGENKNTSLRSLDEFPVIVRFNLAVTILRKVRSLHERTLDSISSSLAPFGFSTDKRGIKEKDIKHNIGLLASDGITYISKDEISKGLEYLDKYKVFVGKMGAEHALEPDKDGKFRIITSSMQVGKPNVVCTHSYFIAGAFDNEKEAYNLYSYLRTKFARFMILLSMSSTNLSSKVFPFLPIQDFSENWTDEKLYQKYKLNEEEISFIQNLMKDMA